MTYDQTRPMGAVSPTLQRDRSWIRAQFPALRDEFVFLENAGGSQVPEAVIHAMGRYMEQCFVQPGAGYPKSDQATETVHKAHDLANRMAGGEGAGVAILGASSTALLSMLSECVANAPSSRDEIIVAECGHEANIGPWLRLADRGFKVKLWPVDPDAEDCTIEGLSSLLGPRTRLVAFPHVSNLLGAVWDIRRISNLCHDFGARVAVDGVAYAPHRPMDVARWGVDWYCFSIYKTFGPHLAALYGRSEALQEIEGPNHYFIPRDAIPDKFEPGGVSHEACAGLLGAGEYFSSLAGEPTAEVPSRADVTRAFGSMASFELPLQESIIAFLQSRPDVRIVGPATATDERVPTISFLSSRKSSGEIVRAVQGAGIGIRNGHMYSKRLCEAIGIDPVEGVVRVSAVHYNSPKEIDRLIEVLERAL